MGAAPLPPFLRIPPFPGARVSAFAPTTTHVERPDPAALVEAFRRNRVGGNYWVPTDDRPQGVVVRSLRLQDTAKAVAASLGAPVELRPSPPAAEDVDLWSLFESCRAVVCEDDDPARFVAALLDLPSYVGTSGTTDDEAITDLQDMICGGAFASPFDGQPMGVLDAIELCGFWRALVESNRDLAAALGFAFWKQDSVRPLLWGGGEPLPFWRRLPTSPPMGSVAVWRSKAPSDDLAVLEAHATPLVEVEDGFLRSAGLGADCVPPLSITVDRLGAYFDPSTPSELERLLQDGDFDPSLLERARELRSRIVETGLGKYGRGTTALPRFGGERVHLLVPGQVEDDRSVMTGGGGMSNLELLRRVRTANPDAFVIYKPHPDVEAGHRKGAIPAAEAAKLADRIVDDQPIAALLDLADEVHVNTSLTGFEALMRGKPVTAHGVPFYAGWGLTTDLGPVPASRSRRRSLDELAAATLLVYPRYLDPVSGLPCPAEVVVRRLVDDPAPRPGIVVRLRRWQGKVARHFRVLGG